MRDTRPETPAESDAEWIERLILGTHGTKKEWTEADQTRVLRIAAILRRIEPTDEERAAAARWRHDRSVDRDKDSPYAGFGPYGTFVHEDKRKRDVDTLAAYAARVLTETADGRE